MTMVSLGLYLLVAIIPCIPITLAVQVLSHPVARTVTSPATCIDGYSWMNDGQGDSPCLTVAYVEAACFGNNYVQPVLKAGYSYTLPNSTNANPCYCSWSSYNLMMACTLCQGISTTVFEWPSWANGCATNIAWTEEFFPSGYELTGNATIPYWAITDPTTWTSATFNIQQASATFQEFPSYITPSASASPSGSSSSSSSSSNPSSSSSSGSSSTDVGGIVGGTIGALAALSLLAIGAYLVYRRHVYKKGAYTTVINQAFIDRGDGAATRISHNRFPSGSSIFTRSVGSPVLYGQSLSPSQHGTVYAPQPQLAYPSLQGSFSPPPRTDTSPFTTRSRPQFDAIPMV
ncbi:hypothetical protein DEU56DRAFT_125963 [Suillus clintonianus]|uniref:uncharacterized protein n=1 Tax=Suillus clintonianus TaxID=1904413 RepID=UPI001B873331|nr:uncharacterized protein DEU56DRAFT_125963 [Suillus clintonianus]KAG2147503.1 hypothetical protein DEU56DRAFT_125963 [Suillus clintonianus]